MVIINIRTTEWLLLFGLLVHLILVPYTKVEESFNVQAVHDMLFLRLNWSQYDHLEFPGVVPRSFTGPFLIASTLLPGVPIVSFFDLSMSKQWALFAVRFCLGLSVLVPFCEFVHAMEERLQPGVGVFLRLITLSQFHFLFYASRTLPNIFAMVLVLRVFQKLAENELGYATFYATFATFVLRFELLLLFGPMFLLTFLVNWRNFSPIRAFLIGLSTLVLVGITILFDSWMWGRWVWPEGEVIYFNVWLNRSHEYGVQPFWWYFISALPRAMLLSVLLVPFGLLLHRRTQLDLACTVMPAIIFLFLYSFLPHKELRFILYVIPLLNTSAANFCAWIWGKAHSSWLYRAIAGALVLHLVVNLILSGCFLYASSQNYPGGEALVKLQHNQRFLRNKPIAVHIDAFSAQNGINRFLHSYPAWEYNKTEQLLTDAWGRFDYLIIGSPTGQLKKEVEKHNLSATHKQYYIVPAFHRLAWKNVSLTGWMGKWVPLKLYQPAFVYKNKVMVMKKKKEDE